MDAGAKKQIELAAEASKRTGLSPAAYVVGRHWEAAVRAECTARGVRRGWDAGEVEIMDEVWDAYYAGGGR